MSLANRLKLARKSAGKSQGQLAELIGVTQSNISQLEIGKADSTGHIAAIANVLGVNALWLQNGTGDMQHQGQYNQIKVEPWDNSTPLDADEVEVVFYKDYLASCGSGSYSEASSSETRRLRMSKTTLRNTGILKPFAITATGDSMQPVITDGATVFIDGGRTTVKDGKIYFVTYGGLAKIKYLYALPNNGLRMKSANPDFSDETLSADDIKQLNLIVQGQVFSVSQMFGL
jgi:phage repressor protein C with HTH and peptisase S24 domain